VTRNTRQAAVYFLSALALAGTLSITASSAQQAEWAAVPEPPASALIAAAEGRERLTPSNPQVSTGSDTAKWLSRREEREPKSTSEPVGQSVLGLGR
jgi:hypothetical protein